MSINLSELKKTNYVRKADRKTNYWFDIYLNTLNKLKKEYDENFNIIIHNTDEHNPNDFYIIPYSVLKYILIQETSLKSHGNDKSLRWMGSIKNHQLEIRNCPAKIDVSIYYGNPFVFETEQELSNADENEYAIENKIIEIKARVKQSVFRKKVLVNFQERCCLTGISAKELIIASHIIPWADKIETRLNPSNGLCLFVTFDKLFDEGYISFSDDLKVIVTPQVSKIEGELKDILLNAKERKAVRPQKYSIKKEFLEYHRDIILRK